jgi:hypothetical protein
MKISCAKTKRLPSMKLLVFPLLASLTALLAFTNKTPGTLTGNANDISFTAKPNGIPVDTPRIKHFARVEVKKITGKVKGMLLDDVMVYIINGKKYFDVELGHFKHATIKADEMIITPANDANAKKLYGGISMKGVIEFKNARLIPPMVNLTKNKPLFVLNGEEQENVQKVKSFDPNAVTSIKILENATSKYGLKANNGAVEIGTNGYAYIDRLEDNSETIAIGEIVDQGKPVVDIPSPDDHNKVFEKVEIDASFRGGQSAWQKYLDANLDKFTPGKYAAPGGTYTVWLQFIVDREGNVSDFKALTAHGYGMEAEALRVVKKTSGKWNPGVQNGRQVRSITKQPVTFVVDAMMEAGIVPDVVDMPASIPSAKQEESPDKIYERVEIEASFKGGELGWNKFLETNLNKSVAKKNKAPKGTYTVWVLFVVDKEGTVSDIKAISAHGFGMETEGARLIKASGKWVPAVQNGRPVKAYRKQPITFVVE